MRNYINKRFKPFISFLILILYILNIQPKYDLALAVVPVESNTCEDTSPACNGTCPLGQICFGPNGTCKCRLISEIPCPMLNNYDLNIHSCGGKCPDGYQCKPYTTVAPDNPNASVTLCGCKTIFPTCGESSPPVCTGWCRSPNEICGQVGGKCDCYDPRPDCGSANAPLCDGACPIVLGDSLKICVENQFTKKCECIYENKPCNSSFFPTCNGQCLSGEACEADLDSNTCRCRDLKPKL